MTSIGTRRGLGPFEPIRELRFDAPFPELVQVRQRVDAPREDDVAGATVRALAPLRDRIRPGMRVAVAAGSRGVADVATVVRAVGEWLHAAGAEGFVVPAMGSHGGGTAQGQVKTLAALGVTEEGVGMPIRSSMATVRLGRIEGGPGVHIDRNAWGSDGVIVVNRVKAHTDYHGSVESGVGKMTAIGLGNHDGARELHAFGPANLGRWIPPVVRAITATGKILGGVAILENALEQTAHVAFLEPGQIAAEAETKLLEQAKRLMGRLPFNALDVLIVDEIGKDKSGTAMDTNVIGRIGIRGTPDGSPQIANIVALGLSPGSGGNAAGVGLADFVPLDLFEGMDVAATYVNAMTSGLGGVQRAKLPMVMPTQRDAVAAALLTCGHPNPLRARIARIADTLHVVEFAASEAALEGHDDLARLAPPAPMRFG